MISLKIKFHLLAKSQFEPDRLLSLVRHRYNSMWLFGLENVHLVLV